MKKEEPLAWIRNRDEKRPVSAEKEDALIREIKWSTARQRGFIILGLLVLWAAGEIGCFLAGLALHETFHFF